MLYQDPLKDKNDEKVRYWAYERARGRSLRSYFTNFQENSGL